MKSLARSHARSNRSSIIEGGPAASMPPPLNRTRYVGTAARLALRALRERRLPLSPRRWLIDLRNLRRVLSHEPERPVASDLPVTGGERDAFARVATTTLRAFLQGPARLDFRPAGDVRLSVILVLFNRAELTLRCLFSLQAQRDVAVEVLIVDNASTDDTSRLLDRLDGATVIRSPVNLGFVDACNLAAARAGGRHLLFLNNDTEVLPGALRAAIETLEREPHAGAVGGRLIFPDGRLQEAGSIIWRDGSCAGYGRGASPSQPAFGFQRDVDFCSGAFLATPRDLFRDLGGFASAFVPAYYEDADYCVRVWKSGRRVIYDPNVAILHVEFASAASADHAIEMQRERRARFVARHSDWLAGQLPFGESHAERASARRGSGLRILVIDDRVPAASAGFGFPRALDLLNALAELGHAVTIFAIQPGPVTRPPGLHATVEITDGDGSAIAEFLRRRRDTIDLVIVSRPHNMHLLRARLGDPHTWVPDGAIVYDAEAIVALRDADRRRLAGESVSDSDLARAVADEVQLARSADAVFVVSAAEGERFAAGGAASVHLVSHRFEPAPTPTPFGARHGLLFVGAFHELSPNADSVVWFVEEILPRVRQLLGDEVRLTVAGQDPPPEVIALQARGVDVHAGLDDLRPLYDRARVFVAPTRFAAGIPFKVGHAASHGVPLVTTTLLASQLEWRDGIELRHANRADDFARACAEVYGDAELWTRLRQGALARVARDYAPEQFRTAIARGLTAARDRSTARSSSTARA
jgi:GT2 family glycosyltransferase